MRKHVAGLAVGVLLAAGGWVAAGKWHDARVAACEQRSVRLATLDIGHPDGVRPVQPASGCDRDRVVAYASWQFVATNGPSVDSLSDQVAADVHEQDVTAFYRRVWSDAEWQISTREPASGPLCARKKLAFGETYVNLSFGVDGMYQLMAADAADAGAVCFW
jgi:hypothetical protein